MIAGAVRAQVARANMLEDWEKPLPSRLVREVNDPAILQVAARDLNQRADCGQGTNPEWGGLGAIRRKCGVVEYAMDGEVLLFQTSTRTLYQLNETASFVWRNCEGRHVDELAAEMSSNYDVGNQTSLEHVREILRMFSVTGLIEEARIHVAAC